MPWRCLSAKWIVFPARIKIHFEVIQTHICPRCMLPMLACVQQSFMVIRSCTSKFDGILYTISDHLFPLSWRSWMREKYKGVLNTAINYIIYGYHSNTLLINPQIFSEVKFRQDCLVSNTCWVSRWMACIFASENNEYSPPGPHFDQETPISSLSSAAIT